MDETISGIMADLDGNIVGYGKGAEKIFGYTEEEVKGKPVAIFHPEEARETVLPRLFKEAMEKGIFEEEVTLVRKNGEEFPARLKVTPVKDENGKITGLVGITTDLSE
jgi:PAS domain S-box-containing protein